MRRIAVVAVHGVADQKLGATAQTLAELLIAQAPNGARYEPGIRSDETLRVPLLEPVQRIAKSPDGWKKQLAQSAGSDFLRRDWSATTGKRPLDATLALSSQGAEFTDYLLLKAQQNAMPTETYTAPCVSLTRSKHGTTDRIDVWEMYWADLSRLSGSVPRILTEMFTLLFRLSSLGRDTVQTAAAHFKGVAVWVVLSRLQTALDWLYSRVLALLFLQLLMLALLLVPFGIALHSATAIHRVLSIFAGFALALWVLYKYRRLVAAILAGAVVGIALWRAPAAWLVGFTWIAILSVLYDWWLRVCEERFRMVRKVSIDQTFPTPACFSIIACTSSISSRSRSGTRSTMSRRSSARWAKGT